MTEQPPPLMEPYPIGGEHFALPQSVKEDFAKAFSETIINELEAARQESMAITSQWRAVADMTRDVTQHATDLIKEVQSSRMDAQSIAETRDEMRQSGLPQSVIESAVRRLANEADVPAEAIQSASSPDRRMAEVEAHPSAAEAPQRRSLDWMPQDEIPRAENITPPPLARMPWEDSPQTEPTPFHDRMRQRRLRQHSTEGLENPMAADAAVAREPMTLQQGIQIGSSGRMMRQSLAGAIGSRIDRWGSEWADQDMPDVDSEGFFVDSNGWRTAAAAAAGARYENRMQVINRAQSAIGSVSQGGGLSGAMSAAGGNIARVALPIGIAYGANRLADSSLRNWREGGRPYQQVYGGSSLGQLGHRAGEWMFSNIGTWGLMDSRQASQLYQGVASTILDSDDARVARDFGVDNYRQYGMDTSMSMRFIDRAAREGVETLDTYGRHLEALSEIAQEGGISIAQAHENYERALQSVSEYTSGAAAADSALAITGAQMGLENTPAENVDMSHMLQDTSSRARLASSMGVPISEVDAAITLGDGEIISDMFEYAIDAIIEASVDMGIWESQVLPAALEMMDGPRGTNGEVTADVAIRVFAMMETTSATTIRRVRSVASGFNLRANDSELKFLIVNRLLRGEETDFHAGREEAESRVDAQVMRFDGSVYSAYRDVMVGHISQFSDDGDNYGTNALMEELGYTEDTIDEETWGAAQRYYYNALTNHRGRRSDAVESLLSPKNSHRLEEISDKALFVIEDGGNVRQITLNELLENPEWLEYGRVKTEDDVWLHDMIEWTPRDGGAMPTGDTTGFFEASPSWGNEYEGAVPGLIDPDTGEPVVGPDQSLWDTSIHDTPLSSLRQSGDSPLGAGAFTQSSVDVEVRPIGRLAEFIEFVVQGGDEKNFSLTDGTPMNHDRSGMDF